MRRLTARADCTWVSRRSRPGLAASRAPSRSLPTSRAAARHPCAYSLVPRNCVVDDQSKGVDGAVHLVGAEQDLAFGRTHLGFAVPREPARELIVSVLDPEVVGPVEGEASLPMLEPVARQALGVMKFEVAAHPYPGASISPILYSGPGEENRQSSNESRTRRRRDRRGQVCLQLCYLTGLTSELLEPPMGDAPRFRPILIRAEWLSVATV